MNKTSASRLADDLTHLETAQIARQGLRKLSVTTRSRRRDTAALK